MNKGLTLTPLLIAVLLLIAGCAPFTAEPSTFTLEGIPWEVSSVELADELSWPPMKSENTSEIFLKINFEIQDQVEVSSQSQIDSLTETFGEIIHKETGRTPDQFFPNREERGGPIRSMTCVFTAVPSETTSVELILPDSQTITITVR